MQGKRRIHRIGCRYYSLTDDLTVRYMNKRTLAYGTDLTLQILLENEVVTRATLSERDSPQFAQPPATWKFARAQPGSKCR
jgi:hypothetical protein